MKRSSNQNIDEISQSSKKIFVVEPNGDMDDNMVMMKMNPGKISREDTKVLTENNSEMEKFLQVNTLNKIDFIGRQMKSLQDMMSEVFTEAEINSELNKAACNFVRKPGHVYHLYERLSGQKYFSMLSPEEWENPPHRFIGSWKLEADYSWTDPRKPGVQYEGLRFLKEFGLFDRQRTSHPAIQFS